MRVALVVTATLLLTVNSFAPWGEQTAQRIAVVAQCGAGIGAVAYGLFESRRVHGVARWWRLLAVGAVGAVLAGQLVWWLSGPDGAPVWVPVYWLFPVFGLAAIVALAWAGGEPIVRQDGSRTHASALIVLDALVAATSCAILVIFGSGAETTSSFPRSESPAMHTAYGFAELVLVVVAAVSGMVYRAERPYRATYLQLGSGLVLIAAADRITAYFDTVGQPRGVLWGGAGIALGALFVGLSLRDRDAAPAASRRSRLIDWAQLILPYSGFLGITLLLAFHVLNDHALDLVVVTVIVSMVVFVAARQVVAMAEQRLLTGRLLDAQRRLAHQVLHDSLTGLPNRLLFAQRLEEAMHDGHFVLIFVDLDDFKDVNDRFGHAAGDDLLCAVGERLRRCVTDADTLARIGGDEFAILIDGERADPEVVADRLRVALRDPFLLHGSSLRVRASMGLVRADAGPSALTSDDLLRQADISMYAGKRLGKNTAVVYQPAAGVRADFPTALRSAAGGVPAGFSLSFQPVVRLPDETLVAVEALARWTAPNGIQIPPETFVAAAEAAGLGAMLDGMVLRLACQEVAATGLDVGIHVNIGATRLGNPGFEDDVRRTLSTYRIDADRLVLEITETLPIVDLADAAAQIGRLNDTGVRVALDDFGAGYNSLTYLHALPVDIVKLDRSLAAGSDAARDLALYRSVVGLCADLGLDVIAEGIETPEQAGTIVAAGCRLAQGHLFGRPAPIADIVAEYGDLTSSVRPGRREA
ncbi:GGDEF-domain containing protein [Mycolicibacterium chubuense]|uniref:Phytochrome-like protein cph2 n=1 Tax=Mycolicibacterium chubuense TaxID=1800 RepID=A0A0J6WII5_MYCCU|nr:EAL domain-containing protein [Mycolicibacterium chubuense]KMO83095.1 Phytochrome-like protein cph2 [Mycolicibacterium chubuense]ORA48982.1 GGDEF-domain containing protein [Mycolicibacterium chubuense]SPY00693.1 diguanylate cyclase/phosphodiesterase [Mycolicibacterium chubuense]